MARRTPAASPGSSACSSSRPRASRSARTWRSCPSRPRLTRAGHGRSTSSRPGTVPRWSRPGPSRTHDRPCASKPRGGSGHGRASTSSSRSSPTRASCTGGSGRPVDRQEAPTARRARSRLRRVMGRWRRARAASAGRTDGGGWTIRRPRGRACSCSRRRAARPATRPAASRPPTAPSGSTMPSDASSGGWPARGARRARSCRGRGAVGGWCAAPVSRRRPAGRREDGPARGRAPAVGCVIGRAIRRAPGSGWTGGARRRLRPGSTGRLSRIPTSSSSGSSSWARFARNSSGQCSAPPSSRSAIVLRLSPTCTTTSRTRGCAAEPAGSGMTSRQPGRSRSGPPVRSVGFAVAICRHCRPSP